MTECPDALRRRNVSRGREGGGRGRSRMGVVYILSRTLWARRCKISARRRKHHQSGNRSPARYCLLLCFVISAGNGNIQIFLIKIWVIWSLKAAHSICLNFSNSFTFSLTYYLLKISTIKTIIRQNYGYDKKKWRLYKRIHLFLVIHLDLTGFRFSIINS